MADTDNKNSTEEAELDTPAATEAESELSMRAFLEGTPSGQRVRIADLWTKKRNDYNNKLETHVFTPDLFLHCTSDECKGNRFFRFEGGTTELYSGDNSSKSTFIYYRCSNCKKTHKLFSIQTELVEFRDQKGVGYCTKYGEIPAFGPQTPPRLLRLFGNERENFLKGRRCESQGLGIGAFSYYRRIVENQKNSIFDEIIRVSESINAPKDLVDRIKQAKDEVQFSNALSKTKDALPQTLLVNGHNPLLLLHAALSSGLHAQSDEECLQIAHDIRVVLSAFAERLGQALNDERELKESLNRLMTRESKNDANSQEK